MLKLRRAIVLDAAVPTHDGACDGRVSARAPEQELVVALADGDGARRAALADVALVGRAEPGDEVVVNVQALDLGLGSGGFDIVHVNMTRGLAGDGQPRAGVMKLNYPNLPPAVKPVEDGPLR